MKSILLEHLWEDKQNEYGIAAPDYTLPFYIIIPFYFEGSSQNPDVECKLCFCSSNMWLLAGFTFTGVFVSMPFI